MKEKILEQAKVLQSQLLTIRRDLHRHPETGFDLSYTKEKVRKELLAMGYEPIDCGKAGLVVCIGGKKSGKTFLLRADMDALPLQEEADVDYRSETPGKMHACGHDMHTAMLLGAAKLLKEYEDDINGTIKLMFQPAEEIFQGSLDMIEHGVLENPSIDAALMIHVIAGNPMPAGMFLISSGGISAASCEQYHITVTGKGGHGSTPQLSIDPITAAAQIHLAMQEINSRELDPNAYGVFTTCKFQAGNASNIIPNTAEMWGTIRTIDPSEQVGTQIKTRMSEIAKGIGMAMRCDVDIEFFDYCPCLTIDDALSKDTSKYMSELVGQAAMVIPPSAGGGSEDFAFISHKIPTISMYMASGNSAEGYHYNIHNPKLTLDDSILWKGSATHAYVAMRWLEEHSA